MSTVQSEEDARTQHLLGRFLREWRGRITLEEAGLPGRRGSRSATLTQEDLARLTGYSVRTISALEQGSKHQPTGELLDALSNALRLTGDERRALWRLASDSLPPHRTYESAGEATLARMIDHLEPNPAYLYDAAYRVYYHNKAFAEWFTDFTGPGTPDNICKWMFTEPHAKHVLAESDAIWWVLVSRVRTNLMRLPRLKALQEMIEELCDISPVFRQHWYDSNDVDSCPPGGETVHLREPGYTDPKQPDDEDHRIPVSLSTLMPMTPDDERQFSVYILPAGYATPVGPHDCAACKREQR
jgi:transcriptional regulator with XRE-family HTH domain